ncbi:MAG TPA: hypothetical protein VGQ37_22335 [Vicinamibacterales bacterium]|nr:hypothetical protein [Vicinamibacterales bacterium]
MRSDPTLAASARVVASSTVSALAVARAGLWILLASHVVATWGTQWDIRWHLLIGRDSFWIPPHIMIYSGVTAIVLISFGVLAWTTARGLGRTDRAQGTVRILGISGTRGYHLAAWGIALTVLAAPIDDLWHRLFGLDVSLWSPPHLLGLLGSMINAAACWLIARETYPEGSRARLAAILLAGAIVYGGTSFAVQPGFRIAYVHGGVRFFTSAILAALLAPLALVVTARVSRLRAAPVFALLVALLIGVVGATVARNGFAWMQPVSFLADEIAKDPTSPIAVAHEMARKNGTTLDAFNPIGPLLALLAAIGMTAIDPRRRPVLAALAYGLTLFAALGVFLSRAPAFVDSLPSVLETAVAAILTVLAGLVGGALARRATAGDHAAVKTIGLVVTLALGVLSAPFVADAQSPPKIPRIGILANSSPSFGAPHVEAFRQGLRDLGYTDVVIETRWAEGRFERLPDLAAELVRLKVDVIKTARTLGLTIPPSLLLQADQVIQ